MKLEDFISESLTQIINGVKKAQKHAEQNNSVINGYGLRKSKSIGDSYYDDDTNSPIQVIDFDIAVTVKEQGKTSGKAGVFVTVFGAGIEGSEENENLISNRLKFSIPILLPRQDQ
jgi:hypothetical protein